MGLELDGLIRPFWPKPFSEIGVLDHTLSKR